MTHFLRQYPLDLLVTTFLVRNVGHLSIYFPIYLFLDDVGRTRYERCMQLDLINGRLFAAHE